MPITVDVEMMLFEAGLIANCVSVNPGGLALSARLLSESDAAEASSNASLTFSFSAFESGMAYAGVELLTGSEADDLSDRILQAVRLVMQQIGAIPPGSVDDSGDTTDTTDTTDTADTTDTTTPAPADTADTTTPAPADTADTTTPAPADTTDTTAPTADPGTPST